MALVMDSKYKKGLMLQSSRYDFVRFTVCDMNGIPRGKIVPKASVPRMIENGLSIFSGAVCLSHRSQATHSSGAGIFGLGNCIMLPAKEHIIPTPWASSGTNTFGLVQCETDQPEVSPRAVARKQLRDLEELGYRFYSGYEYEFMLRDAVSKTPVFDGVDDLNDIVFMEQEPLLTEICHNLSQAGIEIESMHSECGPGQFEITTKAMFGLDTADGNVIVKDCVKVLARERGLEATFMTHPVDRCNNAAHFNHSLWNKDGECVFDNLKTQSCPVLTYWLGGLIKHGAAMTALCSPTVNCYRRLGCRLSPSKINWTFNDRLSTFNVKVTSDQSHCYVENRLPSGSSAGYLVLAATIAAGIDGIKNMISPPKALDPDAATLPGNLEEALKALENDSVMTAALGNAFVRCYCELRRKADLSVLKDSDVTKDDAEALERERIQYFKFS